MSKLRKFFGTILILIGIFPIAVLALGIMILVLPLFLGTWLNPSFFEFYYELENDDSSNPKDQDGPVLTLVKNEDDFDK